MCYIGSEILSNAPSVCAIKYETPIVMIHNKDNLALIDNYSQDSFFQALIFCSTKHILKWNIDGAGVNS